MKNFIWDFDGTLFDTYTHTVTVLHRYLAERGRNYDYQELYDICRVHMGEARVFCGASDAEWEEFFRREAEIDTPPRAVPYEGTEAVLAAVMASGGRNFLYTHRNEVSIRYLERFGLFRYFTDFVTMEDAFPQKPAPDAILHLIRTFSLDPEETVMVGDREIDILSGVNAGVHTCLFTEGNPAAETARCNTKADTIAESMSALKLLYSL